MRKYFALHFYLQKNTWKFNQTIVASRYFTERRPDVLRIASDDLVVGYCYFSSLAKLSDFMKNMSEA